MPLDGDIECSLSSATKPSSQFPVQADVKTDSRCISAKLLSSFHSQPYSSTVKMITAHQAKAAECTQIFVAQDINFLPVPVSGNYPITTTKPESFTHKDASTSSPPPIPQQAFDCILRPFSTRTTDSLSSLPQALSVVSF